MATDWLKQSREAYEASSAWIDSNWRSDLEYSLRAFRNEHAAGSKYLSEDYKHRSRLYRPKTRTVIRKNEAAGAVALFSNMETAVFTPLNPDDPASVAAAALKKELVEYRLTHTIPSFPLVMGALQDAQTTGAVCSYNYWEYEEKDGKKKKDKPCITLRPIENLRIDGGADWLDPVETSPYLCDIIPMYACQVMGMMNTKDPKTGQPKWKKYDEKTILRARPDTMNALRAARLGKQQDPHEEKQTLQQFDTVWVMRWFMRDSQNDDHFYYTLGTEELLTTPMPRGEVYFHDIRPYVIGYAVLETHRTLKPSMGMLLRPLQQEMNEIANQRIDNVKFVLNKRWLVARGRQVDTQSLVRNVSGGVTLTTDPKTDVVESNWPDVTSSSYVEQDRLNADFDDLAGNFSPNTKFANKGTNDTLGGTRIAAQGAGMMTDYLLRTFIETWWEPTLRHLVLLEKEYETDEVVLAVCGKKARLDRLGYYGATEDVMKADVGVTVNVGMGTSNPNERFQKLLMGTNAVMDTIMKAPPNFNVQEFIKEAYSNMGYRDGARFWAGQADPRLMKALQAIKQLQQVVEGKMLEQRGAERVEQLKLSSAERQKGAELQVDYQRILGDLHIRAAEIMIEEQRLQIERLQAKVDLKTASDEHQTKLIELGAKVEEAHVKLEVEKTKAAAAHEKANAEMQKAAIDLQTARDTAQNEQKIGQVAEGVSRDMQGVSKELAKLKADVAEAKGVKQGVEVLNKGLGALAQVVLAPKKKAKKIRLNKPDGKKTKKVEIEFDDGSIEPVDVES